MNIDGSSGVFECVGFDLGHGETAVAKASRDADSEPELLEVNGLRSQITAVGSHPDYGIVIGEEALTRHGVMDARIDIKQKPNGRGFNDRVLQNFFWAYHEHLTKKGHIAGGDASRVIVGCPSGWTIDDRHIYHRALSGSGVPNVAVMPESRAAMIHAKESGKFTVAELKAASVLIVDIGSSTTDLTIVRNFTELPLDLGDDRLGASLIEKAILAETLASHPHRAELLSIFESYPVYRARCEQACRRAKEIFFSNEERYHSPDSPAKELREVGDSLLFKCSVHKQLVDRVVNQPMDELGGQSWFDTFRDMLADAKAIMDSQGTAPSVLLLTGGASRMGFARQICKEMFPGARFQPDPEPEYCIARGLALAGRWDLRADGFRRAIAELCESEEFERIMHMHLPALIPRLVKPLADGMIRHALIPGLHEWKVGSVRTLSDLRSRVDELGSAWISSTDCKDLLNEVACEWFDLIGHDIDSKLDEICRQYRIPYGALRVELCHPPLGIGISSPSDPASLKFANNVIAVIVAIVIGNIFGGGGTALVLAGPLGLTIGLVLGAIVATIGKHAADQFVESADIPTLIRPTLFLLQSVEEKCRQHKPTLRRELQNQIELDQAVQEQLAAVLKDTASQLRKALHAKADEATILIR